ncbi:HET domain-containing protein [Fusarium sp. LHS14.1]|nr:HET domain-containing protein [Fusarium sp. LHS14.1]
MRLLNVKPIKLEYFADNVPRYAILSHTWEEEEVTFQDMEQGRAKDRMGYAKIAKIQNCCSVAREDGYNYVWIDTCCIDKTSSAELTEAINSMYRYYQKAEVCYSFLSDISSASEFPQTKWFTRGWTLQELIAPLRMNFFNKEWQQLGRKESLGDKISVRTGVPQSILSRRENLESASIAQRMSWAAGRKTTRPEDRAYSLMGIFDINMPLLYGEGHKAFIRLQEEILRVSDDHSIFAWKHSGTRSGGGILAETPDAFKGSENIISWNPLTPYNSSFTLTNKGVHLDAPFVAQAEGGLGLMVLHCAEVGSKDRLIGIYLRDPFLTMEHFERCRSEEFALINLGQFSPSQYPARSLCVRLQGMASSQIKGRAISKDHELQPPHPIKGEQNSVTDGVGNAANGDQEKDPQQRLPLAVLGGNEAVVKELLALPNIDADSRNENERTSLSLAAEAGHEHVVDLLLNRREVDINSRDKDGFSPLAHAAARGHEKVVWIPLARSDIVPGSQDVWKRTIVSIAALCGHKNLVRQLLARKDTQRHLIDGGGRSVLSHASDTGQEEVARMILGTGKVHPDLRDQDGRSALWYASTNGHTGLVKLLLETGWVDPTSKDNYDSTAVWQAACNGHCPAVELLLTQHANFEIKGEHGRSPLCQASANGHTDVVKELLNCNADAEAKDEDGATALWHAATRGYDSIVKMLLERGAYPNVRGVDRQTGLWHACQKGYDAIASLLLKKRGTS